MGKKAAKDSKKNNQTNNPSNINNERVEVKNARDPYISIEKADAFNIIDELDPSNYNLLNEILNQDVVKIPIDECMKQLLVHRMNLYYSRKDVTTEEPVEDDQPIITQTSPIDENELILNTLTSEFPEFPVQAIYNGLITANYDIENVRISLLALKSKMLNISKNKLKEETKPIVVCEINSRKLQPGMIRSLQYSECTKRTKLEMAPPLNSEDMSPSTLLQEADQHRAWAKEYSDKASQARANKSYQLSSYYTSMRESHLKNAERLFNDLFQKKFKIQYDLLCRSGSFDMHGFSTIEAKKCMQFIFNPKDFGLMPCKYNYVDVITGHGAHSHKNSAKIKPAILSFLNKSGIEYHEINIGLVRVKLSFVD